MPLAPTITIQWDLERIRSKGNRPPIPLGLRARMDHQVESDSLDAVECGSGDCASPFRRGLLPQLRQVGEAHASTLGGHWLGRSYLCLPFLLIKTGHRLLEPRNVSILDELRCGGRPIASDPSQGEVVRLIRIGRQCLGHGCRPLARPTPRRGGGWRPPCGSDQRAVMAPSERAAGGGPPFLVGDRAMPASS
jgi:hypothetical protein